MLRDLIGHLYRKFISPKAWYRFRLVPLSSGTTRVDVQQQWFGIWRYHSPAENYRMAKMQEFIDKIEDCQQLAVEIEAIGDDVKEIMETCTEIAPFSRQRISPKFRRERTPQEGRLPECSKEYKKARKLLLNSAGPAGIPPGGRTNPKQTGQVSDYYPTHDPDLLPDRSIHAPGADNHIAWKPRGGGSQNQNRKKGQRGQGQNQQNQ